VEIARSYAKRAGVSDLCNFVCGNLETELSAEWFGEKQITHVFCYDGVFLPETSNAVADVFERVTVNIVGVSCSKFSRYWPKTFVKAAGVGAVALGGGKSSFTMGLWKNY